MLFAFAWVLSILGMLDVLTTFRGSPRQIPYGMCAVLIGGGSWILSPFLARRRAESMTSHAPLYRWIARHLMLRILFMEEWRDLLLAAAFAAVAAGHFAKISLAQRIATQVMWWWPYEILGAVYLMLYLAFLEGMSEKLPRRANRLLLLVILFAGLAGGLHVTFRLPLEALAVSGLILLPGYAPILVMGEPPKRIRFLYRGGRALGALVLSFFVLAFLASLLEGPGVRARGRTAFEGSVMVLWGAVYFAARAFLESFNRAAAIRQGVGRDPRWGGEAG